MSPHEPDLAARKRAILAAATALFARKGFEQTTMDDLAAEAGLSKGGLYWHFKSKDDVIMALLAQYFDAELAGLDALAASGRSASESLRALYQLVSADFAEIISDRSLSLAFYAAAVHREDVRQHLRLYYARYRDALTTIIQRGIDAGEFAAAPASEVAIAFIAQFEGILLLHTISPDLVDLPRQIEVASQLLLTGLRRAENDGIST